MTYKQINYMYIQKESVRCILIKIKVFFLISKDFIMNMDTFLISICFYKFNKFGHIQSFPIKTGDMTALLPHVKTFLTKILSEPKVSKSLYIL